MTPILYFPLNKIWRCRKLPKPAGKHANYDSILDAVGAFDIETSVHDHHGDKYALPYLCQFAFESADVPLTAYYTRTMDDMFIFFERLANKVRYNSKLVIYVFNLSYEFQFLTGFYEFQPDEVFATGPHKILFCTMFDGRLEFRDAYILSNMNLAKFLDSWDVEHKKLDGEVFDYHEERWPWTPLTEYQMEYGANDVLGLIEAVKAQRDFDNDDWYTIPKTNTGYVRRDAKRALAADYRNIQKLMPDLESYILLREAFRGGNTHANRFLAGDIIKEVETYDRSSSYPDVMINRLYPMSPLRHAYYIRTEADILKYMKQEKALLMRIEFDDLELRSPAEAFPYLSVSKIANNDKDYRPHLVADNGRILSALGVFTVLTLTDIDFKIVNAQYKWSKLRVVAAYTSRYMPLPESYRELVREYYRRKTEWKGLPDKRTEYQISKGRLNSLYGMCVQQGDKARLLYDALTGFFEPAQDKDPAELLDKYERKAILPYQIGVWVTAWARDALQRMIDAFKTPTGSWVAYVDTDSVYVLKGHSVDIDALNAPIIAASKASKSYATDPAGTTHYMGVWECEHANLAQFKTLGAKKYAYVDDGKVHITISGVNKKRGALELTRKGEITNMEPLELMTDGFVFEDAGKNAVTYIHLDEPVETQAEGHDVTYRNCVVIEESVYTLGLTAEYLALLDSPAAIRKVLSSNKFSDLLT